MKQKRAILGIDIQNDFTDPAGSLFVKGANGDILRMIAFIEKWGSKIDYIALTLDSHQPIHIATQTYWKDFEGYPPALFTTITVADVEVGRWVAQYNKHLALPYLKSLEERGECCTIWPSHCIQGSRGWAIHESLMRTLTSWSIRENKLYELYFKGMHQATEHYSIFRAAVEYDDAIETQLNVRLLDKLNDYDEIFVMGEAADYCVIASLTDLITVRPEMATKIIVVTDCMSWIDKDNQKAKTLYDEARNKGVRFMESTEL